MSEPAWALPNVEPVDFPDMPWTPGLWQPTQPPAADNSDSNLPGGGGDAGKEFASLEHVWDDNRWHPDEKDSATFSLIPIIGTVKDIAEGITGEDVFTHEKLSLRKRIFNFAAAAADLMSFGIGGRMMKGASLGARVLKGVKAGGEVAGVANKAEDIYTIVTP